MNPKVTPGTFLENEESFIAGSGVYNLNEKQFIASRVGTVVRDKFKGELRVESSMETSKYPQINSEIIGKIIKINSRFATVSILVIDGDPIKGSETFVGIIQKKDIRLSRTDTVEISKCFRPGDCVRAKVTSLGEMKSYILSTARNDLGVVLAQSLAGFTMLPISWEAMVCPQTKEVEFRKVAKPSTSAAPATDIEMAE